MPRAMSKFPRKKLRRSSMEGVRAWGINRGIDPPGARAKGGDSLPGVSVNSGQECYGPFSNEAVLLTDCC